jgi:hypothetical protein
VGSADAKWIPTNVGGTGAPDRLAVRGRLRKGEEAALWAAIQRQTWPESSRSGLFLPTFLQKRPHDFESNDTGSYVREDSIWYEFLIRCRST